MGRSIGTKELKRGQLGRNGMAVFAEGRLPEDLGGGWGEIPNIWILLKCYWMSLSSPSILISPTHTDLRHRKFAKGKGVIPQRFSISDFCVSVTLIGNKPVLKRRKGLKLARGNNRFFLWT